MHNIEYVVLEQMKDLVEVDYMPEGCNDRAKELQAWINFGDFLDECDGKFCLAINPKSPYVVSSYSWSDTMYCIRRIGVFYWIKLCPSTGF